MRRAIVVIVKHVMTELMLAIKEAEKGRKMYQYICISNISQQNSLQVGVKHPKVMVHKWPNNETTTLCLPTE